MRAFAAILGLFMMLGGVGIYAYYDSQVRPDKEARELLVEARIGFEKAYGSKDEISNSIDLFSKIIAKYPGTKAAAEAYFYIGHGYEKLGLKRLAYLKYVYALKNNRHRNDALDGEVRTRIARLRLERNYNAEGIHQLLSVIGNSDDKNFRGRGYTELGHAYLKQGKFDEARRMFDTALMEDGDNEDAILGKARCLMRLGQSSDAYTAYENYFKMYKDYDPYFGDVKKSYVDQVFSSGRRYYKTGHYNAAIGNFKRLLRTFPDGARSESAIYWIGASYLALGKYETAIHYFDKVIKNDNSEMDEEARYKKAQTYFIAKRYDIAASEFQNYLNNYPKGKYLVPARKWREECERELLHRVQIRKVPESDYEIDELEQDEGIEKDYEEYKKLQEKDDAATEKKPDNAEPGIKQKKELNDKKNKKPQEQEQEPVDEDLQKMEEDGMIDKVGKNFHRESNDTLDREVAEYTNIKNKEDSGSKGIFRKLIDKIVKEENVTEL